MGTGAGAGTETLLASAERFHLVFEAASVGLLVYGLDSRVVECNEAILEISRTRREQLVGLDLSKVKDQRIVPAVAESLTGAKGFYQGPYDTSTSGAHILVVIHSTPLRDSDGRVIGGVATFEDATERLRIDRELRDQLDLVQRQSSTIRALGTPILKVWDQVLCLPVIGIVDSARAVEMAESMLQAIVAESTRFAIVDLTGVEVVDTATAQHLVRLFRSAELVGVESVLCGIRPAVAQTIIDLGMDMDHVRTMGTMYHALKFCIRRLDEV